MNPILRNKPALGFRSVRLRWALLVVLLLSWSGATLRADPPVFYYYGATNATIGGTSNIYWSAYAPSAAWGFSVIWIATDFNNLETWDYVYDGPAATNSLYWSASARYSTASAGTFDVIIRAFDADWYYTDHVVSITVADYTPGITSSSTASGVSGTGFSYTITGINSPTSFGYTGTLPAGLSLSGATISGTPTQTGTFPITISAANAYATSNASLTITINPPAPVVNSASSAAGYYGSAFSYTITATNSPTSYAVSGALPTGLSLNASTGVISGTPTQAGSFPVTVSASNVTGTGAASLTIAISLSTPTTPSSNGQPSDTSFGVGWSAVSGATLYEVRRGSTSVGTTGSTSMLVSGLLPGTAYAMSVRARDANGIWTAWSAAVNITTAAINPTTDTDGDGIPNVIEQQLGTDVSTANSGDSGNTPQLKIHSPNP